MCLTRSTTKTPPGGEQPSDIVHHKNEMDEKQPLLNNNNNEKESARSSCVAARHVLAFWAFLGFINLFMLRTNISVAIVAMVNSSALSENVSISEDCPGEFTQNSSSGDPSMETNGEFVWNEQIQGYILGAFFYGYCLTQLPGGYLAEKIGGKVLFGGGILIPSILSLVTPFAARFHLGALIAVRVLQGIAQGVVYPAMHSIWGRWAPVMERSILIAVTYAGAQLGIVVAMFATGYLCEYGFAGGWPSVFYVFGGIGCLWSLMWFLIIHDSPSQHPRITSKEREYIERSVGKPMKKKASPPWKKIFASKSVWAIAAAHFANDWGCFTTITCLPQYMKQVLRFNIQQDGMISSLPYMTLWFINTICGPIADSIRRRQCLSTKSTRKLMNSLGLLIPAGLMLGVGYSGCNPTVAVVLLCLGVGFSGFTLSGYSVNHLDISPQFAGILMGITNTVGTTTGFMGPAIVGALTNHNPTVGQWRIFFFITAGVFLFGGVVFALFAEGEESAWSKECRVVQKLPPVLTSDSVENSSDFENPYPSYGIQ